MPEDVARFVVELLEYPDLNRSGEIYSVNGEQRGYWHSPEHQLFHPNPQNK